MAHTPGLLSFSKMTNSLPEFLDFLLPGCVFTWGTHPNRILSGLDNFKRQHQFGLFVGPSTRSRCQAIPRAFNQFAQNRILTIGRLEPRGFLGLGGGGVWVPPGLCFLIWGEVPNIGPLSGPGATGNVLAPEKKRGTKPGATNTGPLITHFRC